ncbi:MAG TPA: type II toxin-antitoxin system antitoxin SocA domain-containing protein [Puia sp.]
MPYSASLIAAIFVKRGIEQRKYVTQMKLQKMVYFAHGYYLAKYGEPLIIEGFEAWKFGPVIPQIYQDYKFYGSDYITNIEYASLLGMELEDADINQLSENARDAVNFTWETLKNISAGKLSSWTHLEGSPWQQVYNENDREIKIDNNVIKDYFASFLAANN